MVIPVPRLAPAALLALAVAVEVAAITLSWGLEPAWDTVLYAAFSCGAVAAGAMVLSRYPRHAIGWLLTGLGLLNGMTGDLAQGWGLRAAAEGWPGGEGAEWVAMAGFLPQTPLFVALLTRFPTGRLLAPRWSLLLWASIAASVTAELGWVLGQDAGQSFSGGRNPSAVSGLPTAQLLAVGLAGIAVCFAVSLVAVVLRFRRSAGVERLQLKWFVLASALVVVALPAAALLWFVTPVVHPLPAVALALWPATIGLAVLRYRLYDVDLVISRTLTYVVLTVLLAAVYAAAVLALGTVVGRGSPWTTAGATLLAAAAFRLLHRRVQAAVDARCRPARHQALAQVSAFLDALRTDRAEPEDVVALLRTTLGDPDLELHLTLPPEEPAAHARADADGAEPVAVVRRGVTLGRLVWHPAGPEQRALLPDVLEAAGLAVEMARLRAELRRRLDDIAASRTRLALVAEEERRRLERDLHDGAQQRLVSIGLMLRHAQHQLDPASGAARGTLEDAIVEIGAAIEELRELCQGLRPALLHAGLGPALRELAGRAPMPVEVLASGERYPNEVEATAYFVACEAITNAAKHADAERVTLGVVRRGSTLVVTVADDGVGGAAMGRGSGLTGLSDRVSAHGGTLRIDSERGRGTTLVAELPCMS